jgi:hypothetical protein
MAGNLFASLGAKMIAVTQPLRVITTTFRLWIFELKADDGH